MGNFFQRNDETNNNKKTPDFQNEDRNQTKIGIGTKPEINNNEEEKILQISNSQNETRDSYIPENKSTEHALGNSFNVFGKKNE